MRVLIQDGQSKKFFTAWGSWAPDARQGEDFESHRHAYAVARAANVAEFKITLFYTIAGLLCGVDRGKN